MRRQVWHAEQTAQWRLRPAEVLDEFGKLDAVLAIVAEVVALE
jgi:hypothetical protein